MNGRFAMLGAAGIIAPEILGNMGVIPEATQMLWFKTGVIPPAGTTDTYWMDPYALFWLEVVAMQFAELRRWGDYRNPGSMSKQYFMGLEGAFEGSGDAAYPGACIWICYCSLLLSASGLRWWIQLVFLAAAAMECRLRALSMRVCHDHMQLSMHLLLVLIAECECTAGVDSAGFSSCRPL